MSGSSSIAITRKLNAHVERIRIWFMYYPQWWVWTLSIYIWVLIAISTFIGFQTEGSITQLISCIPLETVGDGAYSIYYGSGILKEADVSSEIINTISGGILPWIIMIVAMMFPLLNEPVRHVASSIKRNDKDLGIVGFLVGYILFWTFIGVLFLMIPLVMKLTVGRLNSFENGLIAGAGFLTAAVVVWSPNRLITMARCGQSVPIRIVGWQLYKDCVAYGLKMGFACFRMCWAPMLALMLAHHSLFLMFIVTIVLLFERYRMKHTDKTSGYIWGAIACWMIIMAFVN